MIFVRRAERRRHITSGTQDTLLTFDPENKVDPFRRGFRSLEAFNEETPLPAMGLHLPAEKPLEILTYVREGALLTWNSSGRQGHLKVEEFQLTSSSREIGNRFINGSLLKPAHVFQSGITPDGSEFKPGSEHTRFPIADREGVLRLVSSPAGKDGSLRIHQDVRMYSSVLLVGHHLIHEIGQGRAAWLHVVQGRVSLRDHFLGTGDAAGLEDERSVSFTAQVPSEVILFDLA